MDTAGVGIATYEASRGWLFSRPGRSGGTAAGTALHPSLQSIGRDQVESDSQADFARLQAVRQRYKLPSSFLLFVGDLTYRKNILGLISAYAIVQGERPDLHLVLAGAADSATDAALDSCIRKHGIRHRITRTGYIDAEDLPVIYSLAHAFVFPSHDEGFGLPPLEAMACGCPVVCSGGAAIENCGSAAVTCDPRDPASIASAVSLLLDHPDVRKEKIEAGFKKAAEFTWEKAARQTEDIYRKVLAHRPIHPTETAP